MFEKLATSLYKSILDIFKFFGSLIRIVGIFVGMVVALIFIVGSIVHMLGMWMNYFIGGKFLTIAESDRMSSFVINLEWKIFFIESFAWALLFFLGLIYLIYSNFPKEKRTSQKDFYVPSPIHPSGR